MRLKLTLSAVLLLVPRVYKHNILKNLGLYLLWNHLSQRPRGLQLLLGKDDTAIRPTNTGASAAFWDEDEDAGLMQP